MTRRNFIGSSAAATALAYSQINGSNERLRIGVIGCGGQATDHMHTLVKMRESDNCDVLAVCRRV
jgi:ornithine cyclodeaminase/alanine dehydrogenase-like protein (mu-crystallin family)